MNAEHVTSKPEDVIAALNPLVVKGNPYAALWSARLLAAPDPTEREKVVADLMEAMGRAVRAISTTWGQLAKAFGVSTDDFAAHLSALVADDCRPFDEAPDFCWRCDSRAATTDVGLCADCRSSLGGGARETP